MLIVIYDMSHKRFGFEDMYHVLFLLLKGLAVGDKASDYSDQ